MNNLTNTTKKDACQEKNKKQRGNGYGKGTFIESQLYLSPAFLSLGQPGTARNVSTASAQILILFLGKRSFFKWPKKRGKAKYERQDANEFTLTYKELAARNITQHRSTRAFDELLEKGFIKIVRPGGAYNKDKAVYALTDDFKGWRVGDEPIRIRKRDVKRGFQGRANQPSKKIIADVGGAHDTDVGGAHPDNRHGRPRRAPLK